MITDKELVLASVLTIGRAAWALTPMPPAGRVVRVVSLDTGKVFYFTSAQLDSALARVREYDIAPPLEWTAEDELTPAPDGPGRAV